MTITDVKVFPVEEDKLKAYATVTFDNCFIVRDLKVIAGNKGFFIAMPSKKRKDGTFRDIAHPLNAETRALIEQAVLEVFQRDRADGTPAATAEACEDMAAPEAAPVGEVPSPLSLSQPATGIPDIKPPSDPAKAFGYEEK